MLIEGSTRHKGLGRTEEAGRIAWGREGQGLAGSRRLVGRGTEAKSVPGEAAGVTVKRRLRKL